ncbi:hypothetical protein PSAR109036_04400 [Psychrobacter arenosus]|uniref:hypothetical protein n=1 Tax=Psychrobacter arenosus TaxID=256326 RepID=UPI0019192449|nr:hypothetical protein [Psychrobacter arenosus]
MNNKDASVNDPAAMLDNLEIVVPKSNTATAQTDAIVANDETLVVVNLKAKLRPEDQGELEDAFLDVCEQLNLQADIVGGGSLLDDNGESFESVIEIALAECNDTIIDHIIGFFESTLAPKGSSLTIYEPSASSIDNAIIQDTAVENTALDSEAEPAINAGRKIHFGHQEGLGLYLNGKDLAPKIYQKYDIRHVFDKCNSLLKGVGMVNSYWQGYSETALYMYGDSYEQMVKRIEPFVSTYPLCNKSKMVKIA